MRVLIAGCGWLGLAVARRLSRRGHRIVGVRRDPRASAELAASGIEPLLLDLATAGAAARIPDDVEAIVACQAAGGRSVEEYERAYLAANRSLLEFAGSGGVRRLVYASSTGVFGQNDGGAVDEASPIAPATVTAEVLAHAERLILDAPTNLSTGVVRMSGLYGPGRYGIVDRVRDGRLALGPGDSVWMNFCHLDDAAETVVAVVERGRDRAVYHGSDASPARRRDVVRWIADRLGIAPPSAPGPEPERRRADRRVLARATRKELDLELAYPSFREGLAPILERVEPP